VKELLLYVPLVLPVWREMAICRAFFFVFFVVPNKEGLLLKIKSYIFLKVCGKGAPPPYSPVGARTEGVFCFVRLLVGTSRDLSK
jgi:hypothetical protein